MLALQLGRAAELPAQVVIQAKQVGFVEGLIGDTL